jgi:hypothetical protein
MSEKVGRECSVVIYIPIAVQVPGVCALSPNERDLRLDLAIQGDDTTGDITPVLREESSGLGAVHQKSFRLTRLK